MIGTLEETPVQDVAGADELAPHNYEHDAISYYNAHILARTGERFRPLDFVDGHTIFLDRALLAQRRENRRRISGRVSERSMTSRSRAA